MPIQRINQVQQSFTSNAVNSTRNSSVPINAGPKNSKTKTAVMLGLTALGTVGVAIVAIRHGKARKVLKELPDNFKAIFNDIKFLEGEEFVNEAYVKLVKEMNLEGIAPAKIEIFSAQKGTFGELMGGYNCVDNKLEISESLLKLSKSHQLDVIAHELKHCEQMTRILRTEGLGAEALARAEARSGVINSFNGAIFDGGYREAREAGKLEEFIKPHVDKLTEKCLEKINKNHSKVLQLPKIKLDSVEGKKATEHLKAIENYDIGNTVFFGPMYNKEYQNNIVEVEAREFGGKIRKMFEDYLSVTK